MQEINVSEAVNAAVNAAKQIHETVNALTVKKDDLTKKIMVLTERNQVLWRLPLRRSDAKDLILKLIDQQASEFMEAAKWRDTFTDVAFPKGLRPNTCGVVDLDPGRFLASDKPINLQDYQAILGPRNSSYRVLGVEPTKNFFSGTANLAALDARLVYFFFGDVIKSKVSAYFDQLFPDIDKYSHETEKLSIEDRRSEISLNKEKIAELNVDLQQVEDMLKELSTASAPRRPGELGAAI